jgi:MAC/Perforin domain-containing protein
MAETYLKEHLKNFGLVGGCYDMLRVDPINISSKAAKYANAFDIREFENIDDWPASKPVAMQYRADFGGGTDRVVTELSSSYDFQTFLKREKTLSVSDSTGALFAATLSDSFEKLNQETRTQRSVLTYVSEKVTRYWLRMSDTAGLSADLKNAFEQLPEAAGPAYTTFITTYGTHYLKEALYGGRATQRLSVSTEDYVSLLEQGVNFGAQANLTLDRVKSAASANSQDKRSQKFTQARSLTVGKVVYVGGYTQEYLDMWAMQVPEAPMPIEAKFLPLYELLTPVFLPDADRDSLKIKSAVLQKATEDYLASQGIDVRASRLRFGDNVALELEAPGRRRVISSAAAEYARTVDRPDLSNELLPQSLQWTLVDPFALDSKEEVTAGRYVALRSVATGKFLDAQAGSDQANYWPGDGLTAAVAADATKTSTHWTLQLPSRENPRDPVDGDVVHIKSRWQGSPDSKGYLLGEPDVQNAGQRVYAFGDNQAGAIWTVRRVTLAK